MGGEKPKTILTYQDATIIVFQSLVLHNYCCIDIPLSYLLERNE